MSQYPEIAALNKIYIKHKVEIRFSETNLLTDRRDFRAVELKLDDKVFNFNVEDEYDDARYDSPLLNLCLVLRELEHYAEVPDYLVWCKEKYLDPKNQHILVSFKSLQTIYTEIHEILGKIDSQVSDWDFQMGSGASWELRKKNQ